MAISREINNNNNLLFIIFSSSLYMFGDMFEMELNVDADCGIAHYHIEMKEEEKSDTQKEVELCNGNQNDQQF